MPRCPTGGTAAATHAQNGSQCACCSKPGPVQQNLDELDFARSACAAAQAGDIAKLERLVKSNPDAVHMDGSGGHSGYTPLHYASRAGRVAAVQLLLKHGADPNRQTRAGGSTALHRAAYMGHLRIVDLLLLNGADGALQDSDRETALHKALTRGHNEVGRLLAECCPQASMLEDRHGFTPAQLPHLL